MPEAQVVMSPAAKNVILIGYRGSGKTTLGRALADRLKWSFSDTDQRIAERVGCDVRTFFARDGEPAFRDVEQAVIGEVCRLERQVIAVGGGAVLRDANRTAMKAAGVCIWLTASVAELRKRLAADAAGAGSRPALTPAGVLDEIAEVLQARMPLYAATADFSFATDGRAMAEVLEELMLCLPHSIVAQGAR